MMIHDNPARVGDPEPDPEAERYCEECGEPIWGNYYDVDGFIYCPDCMREYCKDSKKAPDWMTYFFLDAMDEYRVLVL